jgi:hypothetical protein
LDRINRLHGFFPFTAFPENGANASIRVMDPASGNIFSYAVDGLDVPYPAALLGSNPQYAQHGDWLYITGGYGRDAAVDDFVTFPVLTAVDLPALVAAVLAGEDPSGAFRQLASPEMRVCGGEMDWLDGYFYLVGGHDFAGNYSQSNPGLFTQAYTYEIRKFRVEPAGDSLAIVDYTAYHDEENLRRRDFSLAPLLRPDGGAALGLYGGVFRPDEDLPYYHPVYISGEEIFGLDTDYEQAFSQYTCPTVPLFDSTDSSMYTLFFGGLSVHYYNTNTGEVEYDERVPFIKDITALRRQADNSTLAFLLPQRFDELLGTNMIFAPAAEAPHYENEVLKLRAMSGPTFVGYLFGGIKAEIPNITPSSANHRLFGVYITPKPLVSSGEPRADAPVMVYPNPYTPGSALTISTPDLIRQLALYRIDGVLIGQFGSGTGALEAALQGVPGGVYLVQVNGRFEKLVVE